MFALANDAQTRYALKSLRAPLPARINTIRVTVVPTSLPNFTISDVQKLWPSSPQNIIKVILQFSITFMGMKNSLRHNFFWLNFFRTRTILSY